LRREYTQSDLPITGWNIHLFTKSVNSLEEEINRDTFGEIGSGRGDWEKFGMGKIKEEGLKSSPTYLQ
jgi:hypothetical protein